MNQIHTSDLKKYENNSFIGNRHDDVEDVDNGKEELKTKDWGTRFYRLLRLPSNSLKHTQPH